MGFFDSLNALAKDVPIDEETAKELSPFLANRWIYFSGFHKEASDLNKFSFVLPSPSWLKLAQKSLPNRYIKWAYIKQKEKVVTDFFVDDIARYFKLSKVRAKETLLILTKEEKLTLAKKFGYNKKELKKLGFKVSDKKIQIKKLSEWW